ncbi:hypothetical protein ACFV9P_28025 [Streptomyces sp. NPDC059892]|uniref:hypothetical protein n=1 Tax=Streptomyces sp. NPDC059892 TaxID=3346989 RepID=UPI00365F8463
MRTRITTALAATLLLATLTACGSSEPETTGPKKLDAEAGFACDDFAADYKAAQTTTARVDLANKVNKWAQESKTERIAEMGAALARGSEGSADAWQMSADGFAQACLDAGWKA